MKVLVLGAGAIGGFFGARLQQAGADVTFLVRPGRLAQLQAHGLQIQSPLGDARLQVDVRLKSDCGAHFDVVLLACKAYDLDDATDTIAPAMTGNVAVLPLLNGVAHMPMLSRRFGADRVLGGTARIAATLRADGVILHLNDWCTITFGEQDRSVSSRVAALKALFDATTVDAKVSTDIHRDLWHKFVHLHTIASMTSLMRANVGEIVRTPDGVDVFRNVLDTNIAIARSEGHDPDSEFIATYRALFANPESMYEASLLRDIERGGAIEADHILGYMLERCRAHGLPATAHQLAYTAAKAYEQRRQAKRLPG